MPTAQTAGAKTEMTDAYTPPRINLAERDSLAKIIALGPTRRRRSAPDSLAADYWRDVHGVAVTSLGGLSVYNQQHLEHDRGDNWPTLPGVSNEIEAGKQLDGIAEFGWASQGDAEAFGVAAEAANVLDDEQNLFSMVSVQTSPEGASKTYFDSLPDPTPNGPENHHKLFICFRKAKGVETEDFRAQLADHLAPILAKHELLLKVRLSAVDDFDPATWDSPNVDNEVSIDEQYQAYLEVVFKHRLNMRRFYESEEFAEAVDGLERYVRHVNAFPVQMTVCNIFRGAVTLSGRFGSTQARQITGLGALNRWDPETLA
jgi:hypothetical protein